MMFATLFSKVAGLLRDVFIAARYGTETMEAVAYSYASSLPVQLFDFTLGAAVLATFIPIFNNYIESGNKKRAFEFSNNFINIVVFISTVVCAICMLFSKQIGVFIAPDLNFETQQLLQKLIVIVLPTTIFTALAYSFVGILQSLGEFNIPAIISMVSNLVIIAYVMFFNNVYGLCIAMLVGWAMQFIIQIPALVKKKYKYQFSLNFRDNGIKEAMILAIPILASSWVQPISVFVNKRYASAINGGGPALDYANRFYIIIVGVFVLAITNYIFPALSKKMGADDHKGFAEILIQSLRVMFLIIIPVSVGMMMLSEEIITIIYGRGQFSDYSIKLTSTALTFFSCGMIAYGVNEILNKSFYSMKNAKMPMIASVFGILASVILSFLAVKVWDLGIAGLAIASTVSSYIVAIILFSAIQKKYEILSINFVLYILKLIVSVLLMVIVVLLLKKVMLNTNVYIKTFITAFSGALTYFIALFLLKVKEVREVIR